MPFAKPAIFHAVKNGAGTTLAFSAPDSRRTRVRLFPSSPNYTFIPESAPANSLGGNPLTPTLNFRQFFFSLTTFKQRHSSLLLSLSFSLSGHLEDRSRVQSPRPAIRAVSLVTAPYKGIAL